MILSFYNASQQGNYQTVPSSTWLISMQMISKDKWIFCHQHPLQGDRQTAICAFSHEKPIYSTHPPAPQPVHTSDSMENVLVMLCNPWVLLALALLCAANSNLTFNRDKNISSTFLTFCFHLAEKLRAEGEMNRPWWMARKKEEMP